MENVSEPEYESPPGSDLSSELGGGNANTTVPLTTAPDSADGTRNETDAVERFVPVRANQEDHNEDSSVSDPGPPSEVDALNARNFLVEETLLAALAYQPRPSDVFTVSYPKCGSALLQFLVFGVLNRGEPSKNFEDFAARTPYLEWMGIKSVLEMRRPGAIKTHLPFEKNPHSPHAKYIYMARNPFDCCASYYTHMRTMPLSRPESASFDIFFDAFLEGKVIYGDYFDHVLSWYDHRSDPNVLFVTYEDVKSDPRTSVIRIADFVDPSIGRELRENSVLLSNVLKMASANNMTTTCHQGIRSILGDELSLAIGKEQITTAEFYKNVFAEALEVTEASDFTRTPVCGRWKEFFKPEHVQRMYEWIDEKTAGSDVFSIWSSSDLPRLNPDNFQ
ncbi:sulfotransferase 1E1 [Rhipicephalus microplus]|uniref:sulfotransferase 1E1 n=1 Tax=Rhipicephalus microplus TaxID=6941 RepID=UPI003F6CAA13